MQKPDLLLMAPNLLNHLDALTARCTVHRYDEAADRDALIEQVGEDIEIVATNGHIGCAAELMQRLPALKMIGCYGVGYDAIDIPAARARGIAVTNTPDVLNDAVAELAMGLMVSLARRIPQGDRFVRDGHWLEGEFPLTSELTGRTAGIVGLGRIGKELANRLQAMKMRVVYHGRQEQPNLPFTYYADLEAMAADVDWLVVCLPGGQGTDRIISSAVLKALGPSGCLVNVARGSVVDEAALCEAIRDGGIGGAALDVFAAEPQVPDILMATDNVVLSPHAASGTAKTRNDMGALVIRNIEAHLDGLPLLTRVA